MTDALSIGGGWRTLLQVFAKDVAELADKVKKRDHERRLKMVEVRAL